MDLGLRGRCLVVTGASRGLGLATATQLVDEGANVVLVARDQAVLDTAVEDLGPGNVVGIAADLRGETIRNGGRDSAGEIRQAGRSPDQRG